MTAGALSLSMPADSVDVLLDAIDFASKGLSQPRVIEYDPPSRRLVLKAIYYGPKTGWPVLDRQTIERIAGKTDTWTGKPRIPICVTESEDGSTFPMPVIISIALSQAGSTSDAYLHLIRAHSQLYVNDYRPFQLPVAFWRAAEGIWVLVRDEGAVGLPEWWAEHVRPMIEENETRQKVTSWRRSPSLGGSVHADQDDEMQAGVRRMEVDPRKTGMEVDDEEEESMVIERGWLGAVEILIQMADILLSLHERHLSIIVSRPDFYDIVENRTFSPRSQMSCAGQRLSLELNHMAAAVPMQGYDEGKLVDVQSAPPGPGDQVMGGQEGEKEDGWMVEDHERGGAVHRVLDEAAIMRHLRFIAPEAISSKQTITPAADVYSWAATAFELINGSQFELGFNGNGEVGQTVPDFYGVMHSHSTHTMPSLKTLCPSIPDELSAIIRKAGSLDPEERYANFSSLLHDLSCVKDICGGTLRGKQRRDFAVGNVDLQARFEIPPGLLDREKEYGTLEEAYRLVKTTGRSQVGSCWGPSGSGKSKLLEAWARTKEREVAGQRCLVGWAKMDQHLMKPLSAFISVFCSLLKTVFSDPRESTLQWRRRILNSLAVNGNIFLALLPKDWRNILLDGQESEEMDSDMTSRIDWESWVKQFRTWSYGLLRLFASEERPLIIIIDDIQWMEPSERELWDELTTSATRRLDHCLILLSYRTNDDIPPELGSLASGFSIRARPFDQDTVARMVIRSFHLPDGLTGLSAPWQHLIQTLYQSTLGNPFDLRWALSTMVRDGTVYYDYNHQRWDHRLVALTDTSDVHFEDSATRIFHGLRPSARLLLCHLACLPSRGVEISLLARLLQKSESEMRSLLDECVASGAIAVREHSVQFVHDKPHAAILASISPAERSRLFATIARALEGISTDFNFIQADMLLAAYDIDSGLLTRLEVVTSVVRAARTAAVSGALKLASCYLERVSQIWPYHARDAWTEDPELAFNTLTVTAEVALGSKAASRHILHFASAVDHAPSTDVQLNVLIWLFRLELSATGPQTALKTFFRAMSILGYGTSDRTSASVPSREEDILALLTTPPPPHNEEGRIAMSLADFMGVAGPTIYNFTEPEERRRILEFVIPLMLRHNAATKHPATAYTFYLYAIVLGIEDTGRLKSVTAWIKVADTYRLNGGPIEAAVELCRATVAYITTTELDIVDYTSAQQLCLATNNYDILTYVLGLDLATKALAGSGIGAMFRNGKATLASMSDSLQPVARMMAVPFIQFGANLTNSELFDVHDAELSSLSVLQGDFVTATDIASLPEAPPLYALVYGVASLYLGLLSNIPREEIRQRASVVQQHQHAGIGTIFRPFCRILEAIAISILDDGTETERLASTCGWLDAFPQNCDFQALAHMLRALQALNDRRRGISLADSWLAKVESALEHLDEANSHLFAGLLCIQVDAFLQSQPSTSRLRSNYLRYARSAFQACEAVNLVRVLGMRYATIKPRLGNPAQNRKISSVSSSHSATLSPSIPGRLAGDHDSKSHSSSASRETIHGRGKLELEEILRSFLILASEKNSDGLIRRVLQVLLQVTCTQYACFATNDPVTGSILLKGYGTYEDIKVCSRSLEAVDGLAPGVLLSHVAITRKALTETSFTSVENASLIAREPFFDATGIPKTLLVLPLFVQGRFSALLYLSNTVPSSGLLTSQVGLLATFAAIILESNQAYATLEATVTTRTQQLQHALHSRSTFISGVSHELRTPLFAISGLCSVMEASSDLTESQSENLRVISQSAHDLQRIVTDVLDWSKLDAGSMTPEVIPFDLRVVVENALETVSHLARSKNISLLLVNSVLTDPPMALLGDPHRYRQCLLNLLSNAIKFTKPSINNKPPTVSVIWSWRESLNKVEITCAVKDEGIGIHAKSMHKLFQSFSQVDSGISRTFGGTGLGLSITRGLARTLGGDCWAESLEGQGSTFYLLVTTEKAKKSKNPAYLKDPSASARRAIILAENSPAFSVLQANLEAFGIQTTLGSIEDSVIEPLIDLVIVDVGNLTVTSTVLADLKARYVASKFVFLVCLTDQGNLSGDIKDEVIVTKPIKAQSLYNATRATDLAGGGIQHRRKVAGKMDVRYAELYPLRICYVDDSSVNVAVGKKILYKFGYKDIDVCFDGLQAVEAARKRKYDLIFMDLQMPNMDGHQAKKIISNDPTCEDPYIVALTANSDQPTKDRCMLDEQFQGFLTKPLLISSLADTLRAAFERKCAREIANNPSTKDNRE